jgi:two-component sensor histidine kinase
MVEEQHDRRPWIEAAIVFAAWMAFALITAYQTSMQFALRGAQARLNWSILLGSNLLESFFWALATLAVFWLVRRFPIERGHTGRAAAIHGIGAAIILMIRLAVVIAITRYGMGRPRLSFNEQFWSRLTQNILYFALLLGVAYAMVYYRRYRERERAAERLSAGLATARLQALKMQLQPHFLFNTLNAISALIPADAQPARRMVAQLGDLLRISLDHEETQEVTLRDELTFLEPYLEIEKARLGDRLTVEMNIDPETLSARVPHLILQPLVENAVRHGIAPRVEPGKVTISAKKGASDSLELEIRDDGLGIERSNHASERKGVGLSNIQSRLEQLYGDAQRFELDAHPQGGAVVRIRLPLRRTESPSAVTA